MYFPTREDAARFYVANNHAYSAYEQPPEFSPQYNGMRSSHMYMMAPLFTPLNSPRSDPSTSSTNEDVSSAAQEKTNLDVSVCGS